MGTRVPKPLGRAVEAAEKTGKIRRFPLDAPGAIPYPAAIARW